MSQNNKIEEEMAEEKRREFEGKQEHEEEDSYDEEIVEDSTTIHKPKSDMENVLRLITKRFEEMEQFAAISNGTINELDQKVKRQDRIIAALNVTVQEQGEMIAALLKQVKELKGHSKTNHQRLRKQESKGSGGDTNITINALGNDALDRIDPNIMAALAGSSVGNRPRNGRSYPRVELPKEKSRPLELTDDKSEKPKRKPESRYKQQEDQTMFI